MPRLAIACEALPSSSSPWKRTEPVGVGGAMPMIALQSVVLPMPLRPMIAIDSLPISNETSSSACARP